MNTNSKYKGRGYMKRWTMTCCACALSVLTAVSVRAADDAEALVTVNGTGAGVTEEAALKDAYRDAVESAVGMYVDAEQMVKNDELIKDQILTQSNAYIEKRTVLRKEQQDGLVKVKIAAVVRKRELAKRIQEVMPSQTVRVGSTLGNLHARNETLDKRSEDGVALLAKALEDFHPAETLVDFKLLSSEPAIMPVKAGRRKTGDDDGIHYLFSSEINAERYFSAVNGQLRDVFRQISLVAPKKESVAIAIDPATSVASFRQAFESGDRRQKASKERRVTGPHGKKGRVPDALRLEKPYNVLLVTGVSPSGAVAEVEMYQLDDAAYHGVLKEWARKGAGRSRKVEYRVLFKDETEKVVYQVAMRPAYTDCYGVRRDEAYFAPWFVLGFGNLAASSWQWRSVAVPREVQPLVRSITVEQLK